MKNLFKSEDLNVSALKFWHPFNAWYIKQGLESLFPYAQLQSLPIVGTKGVFDSFLATRGISIYPDSHSYEIIYTDLKSTNITHHGYIDNEDNIIENYKLGLIYVIKNFEEVSQPF